MLFMEMGTGKSKVVVDNIGVLFEQGEIERRADRCAKRCVRQLGTR